MKTNRLITETSPYLLQHAHNPVDWYPWSEEAFKRAHLEDKLVLISIGYSSCHWCHVMEKESFEDTEVAQLMNKYFICIKVDREERPDVDHIYMQAVQMLTGRGGWPLNCFALPDKQPVYGGTYFPKENWVQVLTGLTRTYSVDKDRIINQADQLTHHIRQNELLLSANRDEEEQLDHKKIYSKLSENFDTKKGGILGSPKFPMPSVYNYLLKYYYFTKNHDMLNHVTLTLDRMANGGIFDQLGGGFARYSVDENWFAPHFEKMLYDNAQLVELYSNAYKTTGKKEYKTIVSQTIDFIKRELTTKDGAFMSALDADSEGDEGKFYVWKLEEIRSIIGTDPILEKYYGLTEKGNWENGKNILAVQTSLEVLSKDAGISIEQLQSQIDDQKNKLFEGRSKRIRPGLDDKVLTEWNALMLSGLCMAYNSFQEPEYLDMALKNATFLKNNMIKPDFRIDRNYKNGKSSINGFLSDYAQLSKAFIDLYQCTFDEQWIQISFQLAKYVLEHFYDFENETFYLTSDLDEQQITRVINIDDNVIPSATSTIVKVFELLSHYFNQPEFEKIVDKQLHRISKQVEENPYYYSRWASISLMKQHSIKEVVIAGEQASNYRKQLAQFYLPNAILGGSTTPDSKLDLLKDRYQIDKTLLYICENKTCNLPVGSVENAVQILNNNTLT